MRYGGLPRHLLEDALPSGADAGRIDGAVVALVVDNVDPKRLARVRLSFPTIPGDDASAWAPLSALGAGADRGWFFLPEVGDEVLVLFEHGDISRPVVVGALWNGEDPPPHPGGTARACIVSRSGSRIVFDDEAGAVRLEDGGGAGVIEINTEGRITLEASEGDVCVQAPAGEMCVAAKSIDIAAQASCHLESLGGIAIGADRSAEFRGTPLQVHGQKVELNPGGVSSPDAPSAECEQVPDPIE